MTAAIQRAAAVREFVARIGATEPESSEARALYREAAEAGVAREVAAALKREGETAIAEADALWRDRLRVVKSPGSEK